MNKPRTIGSLETLLVLFALGASSCSSSSPSALERGSAGSRGDAEASPHAGSPSGVAGETSIASAASDGGAPLGSAGANGGVGGGIGVTVPTVVDCRREGDGITTLAFINRCGSAVSYRGSDIDGGSLQPGAVACTDIGTATEAISSKRYWGWIGDDPGAERHTLAEFTFNTDFYDFDWYNISHVDAHNLPMQIVPVDRADCDTLTCAKSLLSACPPEGRMLDSNGAIVACVSPDRDNRESPVALYFESCDDAYAWSGDDQFGSDPSPMHACAGEDWDIVFCPSEPS